MNQSFTLCRASIFVSIFALISLNNGFAQSYFSASEEEFGKSRIQYKYFEWHTIQSNNFEFNYSRGGEKIAKDAAKIAESEYDRITELLGYTPFTAMKIFLYNSPKELEQSNIGLLAPTDLDGSILNLAKSRVQIAYTGNEETFKKQLVQQISRLFVYDMLYGGSLKEVLQNSLLLTVPTWYMSGIAEYIANDHSDETRFDMMRTAILKNKDKKLESLEGKDAAIIGESIWNYIATKYGKDNISNILNLTRIIRTEQSSITSTLGISYSKFLREWREYYSNRLYENTNATLDEKPNNATDNEPIKIPETPKSIILEKGEVDTDNYEFDEENINTITNKEDKTNKNLPDRTTLNLGRFKENFKIKGPLAYQNLVVANDMKFELLMDPARRLGLKGSVTINDLLENHNIRMAAFVTPTLRNHDIFLGYSNYVKRIDWGVDIMRRSIAFDEIDDRSFYLLRPLGINIPAASSTISPLTLILNRRIFYHKFSAFASYPISQNLKLIGIPSLITATDIDINDLSKKTLSSTYLGLRGEVVFDNTSPFFNKMLVGTRAKIRLEQNYSLKNNNESFRRLVIDARHYQKIFGKLLFASRLSYSRSLGNSPKITFLGGVENSINREVELSNSTAQSANAIRDLRGMLFYDFAGNLRGFNFGKIYGTSHLLTNFELRLPLAPFMAKGSLTSNFIRNLQFVAFSDIGTSWFGKKGPFNRQNSLNTEVVGGGTNAFRATVTNFKNPFLVGYGVGARTTILGLFLKADYAWGLEDKEVGQPKLYLSVGYDF